MTPKHLVGVLVGALMLAASLWSSPGFAAVLTANDDNYATLVGVTLDVPAPGILSNDLGVIAGDIASLVSGPAHGIVFLFSTGQFSYQPIGNFSGVEFFTYHILSVVTSNTATVRIEVVEPNAVPLPAALPLFASGAGVLGFIGWRRKKKAAALAA
jgi:Big-like domain-containing protein/PEP-CTERM motif-containing protein